MKLDHQKLTTAYIAEVTKICEACEDKSYFGIPEIVSIIAGLIDSGQFYLPATKASVLELCDKQKKLSPEWSPETNAFVDELYSRLEWAETELEVFNLRLKKQWTAGSNLYGEKDLTQAYNQGYEDGKNNLYGEERPKLLVGKQTLKEFKESLGKEWKK